MKIGIVAESTGLGLRAAIAEAAKVGAAGIQFDVSGDLLPDRLVGTGRREFKNLLRSYNLELAALNLPLRHGLDEIEHQQQRIDHARAAMQMAFDLGARKLVAPLPKLPKEDELKRGTVMRESLAALAPFGDRIGTVLAMEIGFDSADAVKAYFASFDSGSLKVAFDPANLLLHGRDPLKNLAVLHGMIAHVLARDARSAGLNRGLQEVPVGAGDVDWLAFTATLQVMEFGGFLCVKRDQGENKRADVAAGVKFLRRFAAPGIQVFNASTNARNDGGR
ncbi:MAG: sugar phosphate isomerase/epimerase family protein [Gemmataceae bacterium]